MSAYSKICPICSTAFFSMRINAVYCSKKCTNRTRSMPKELVASLIERCMKYTMVATQHTAQVRNKDGYATAIGYVPKNATPDNPLGDERNYLIALAKEQFEKIEQRKQSEEIRRKRESEESESGFIVVDGNDKNEEQPEQPPRRKYNIRKLEPLQHEG